VKKFFRRIGITLLILLVGGAIRFAYNHHQVTTALQQKLDELDRIDPAWRQNDIEAARPKVPDEENGAICLAEVGRRLPENWHKEIFSRNLDDSDPNERLPEEEAAQVRDELDRLQTALKKAREMTQFSRGRFPLTQGRLLFQAG
jgi:hypothetical protein